MLTFMGHWPTSVAIPGTDLYVAVPFAGAEPGHGEATHHDHAKHCHGDAASCTDAPAAAGVSIALVTGLVTLPVAGGLLSFALLVAALPLVAWSVAPDRRPPRPAAL